MNIDTEKLQEAVVAQAVAALVDQFGDAGGDIGEQIQKRVAGLITTRVNDEIDRQIKKVVEDGLEKIVFPQTNAYGEEKKPPQTMREFIAGLAHKVFTEYVDANGRPTEDSYYRKAENQRCNKIIKEAIDKATRTEIENAVKTIHTNMNHYLGEYVRTALAEAVIKLK